MNPNETPPSFSSGAIRAIDHQPLDVATIPNAQRSTDNSQGPSFANLYHDQGNSIKGDSYVYGEQAPSVGAMRQLILSTPSGGITDPYSDGQPPSLNDVARRDASQTGSSHPGNEGSVPQPGMSLTGKTFKDYYPDAFHKGN